MVTVKEFTVLGVTVCICKFMFIGVVKFGVALYDLPASNLLLYSAYSEFVVECYKGIFC